MEILTFISNLMIPLVIMYIVAYGLLAKTDIFDAFLKGATDGLKIVFRILPTLVGLMVAICILSESGFFNVLSVILKPLADLTGFPVAVLPLSIIKMISSSAATGLVLDIFKKFGVDSKEGYLAALLMCCSETIFYTISVYFQATKDEKWKRCYKWKMAAVWCFAQYLCRHGSKSDPYESDTLGRQLADNLL